MINNESESINSDVLEYIYTKVREKIEEKGKKAETKDVPSEEEKASLDLYHYVESGGKIPLDMCRNWVIESFKKAAQRRLTTHSPKFIYPSINAQDFSNVINYTGNNNDGYVRTGNVPLVMDTYGDAKYLAVNEFLFLNIDQKPLYLHFTEDSPVARGIYRFVGDEVNAIKDEFLDSLKQSKTIITDNRVRQVFFPVNQKEYHIITPLMSTPVMCHLNKIIKENNKYNKNPLLTNSETAITAQNYEQKGIFLNGGYWKIPGTIMISYGGSKPQNISYQNSFEKYYYLLRSMPPELTKRKIKIPQKDFFVESINIRSNRYKGLFIDFASILSLNKNNLEARMARNNCISLIMKEVAMDIASVRNEIAQLTYEYKGNLCSSERIMLLEDDERFENGDWLLEICEKFARWFFYSYEKLVFNAISMGDAEFDFIKEYSLANKEIFIQ